MSWLSTIIKARIWKSDNDFLILAHGKRGTGKSTSAISLALEVDKTFCKDRIIFNVEELMDLINRRQLKRGMALVFDELGVAANVKEHGSQANRAASYLLQTIRPFNLCVIFSTPSKSYIDKQLRGLFDMYLQFTSRRFNGSMAKANVFWVQYNDESGKVYRHTPTTFEDGELKDMTEVYFVKPHASILDEYKKRRNNYTYGISEEQTDIIRVKKEYLRRESAKSIADEILDNKRKIRRYLRYWRSGPEGGKKRIDQDILAADYNIGNKTAYKVKKYLEAKLIRRTSD